MYVLRPYCLRHELIHGRIDDPESMHGHPVALQVVGRRLEEEKVLAGMVIVDTVCRASDDL